MQRDLADGGAAMTTMYYSSGNWRRDIVIAEDDVKGNYD
jgi:hypothetical protein